MHFSPLEEPDLIRLFPAPRAPLSGSALSLPSRSCCSVCHSATVFANSLMHCGTTVDAFLRENLDWLKKATNWAKFAATAGAQPGWPVWVLWRGGGRQGGAPGPACIRCLPHKH